MKFPHKVVVQNKGGITLHKNDYIAAGGEGTVCRQGKLAYKVYHDPKKAVPAAKIRELQVLSGLPNVLGPRDIVFDSKGHTPVGFTMPYISDTEFLCRLFSKGFRADHGLDPDRITNLVKRLQQTLQQIHDNDILVVDLNEMNFLVDCNFSEVLFIDVDSYQTPKHRATAIMESIRDRTAPAGKFNEGTDWYSFAVVAFQMYTGYHPYRKGRHPDYKPNDWSNRMDKGLSVFHPDVVMSHPWSDWSMIPPIHLDWLKAVLGPSNERIEPPLPEMAPSMYVQKTVVVTGTDNFEITLVMDYKSTVQNLWFHEAVPCAVTKKGIHIGTTVVSSPLRRGERVSLASVPGNNPVVALLTGTELKFSDTEGTNVGELTAEKVMQYEGRVYSAHNGVLTESTFMKTGQKVMHLTKMVAKILQESSQFFPGVVVQDVLGTCWLTIPYAEGKCSNTRVPEMDGYRIVDAKYDRGIFMAVGEKDSSFDRFILKFPDGDHTKYDLRRDEGVSEVAVHFATLANGICVHQPDDQKIEVFTTPSKIKIVEGPPFHTGDRLLSDGASVMFLDGGRLYRVSLK